MSNDFRFVKSLAGIQRNFNYFRIFKRHFSDLQFLDDGFNRLLYSLVLTIYNSMVTSKSSHLLVTLPDMDA